VAERCYLVTATGIALVLGEIHNEIRLGFILGVINHCSCITFVFGIEPNARFAIAGVLSVIHNAVRFGLIPGDIDFGIRL